MTAYGKQSFQHPQRTILTEGGKQRCAGSTPGGTRAMRLTRMSHPVRIQVQPKGHKLQAGTRQTGRAGIGQSRPGHHEVDVGLQFDRYVGVNAR